MCTSTLKTTEFLSRRLKLSVSLTDHADHRSVSSRQLDRQQQMSDAHTSWECIEAQRGNDTWQNEDVVDWPRRRSECSSPSSTGSLVTKAVMHHRHELELYSFGRHVEPMRVNMLKLPQTAIDLSRITNKTCSCCGRFMGLPSPGSVRSTTTKLNN